MEYQFNLDDLTIGDVIAIIGTDFQLKIMAVHRLTEGGIFHLRADELQPVLDAFSKAWHVRFAEIAHEYSERTSLRDMLSGVKVD